MALLQCRKFQMISLVVLSRAEGSTRLYGFSASCEFSLFLLIRYA